MVSFFHGTRIIGAITFNHTNKALIRALNVKHAVHPSKHKCSSMHLFSSHLFNCDYLVGLQLIKRLKSTPLSCNLELKASLRTHLETSVISTSFIAFVHERQPTDSYSCRIETNNDFLSRKSQETAWVASADCIQKDCTMPAYSAPISSHPLYVVLRSALLSTHDKRKTLLLVPPRAKIMGFLCFSSHDTYWATSKKPTVLLWAHSSHSVGFECRHPWGLCWVYLTTSPEFIYFNAAVFLMYSQN